MASSGSPTLRSRLPAVLQAVHAAAAAAPLPQLRPGRVRQLLDRPPSRAGVADPEAGVRQLRPREELPQRPRLLARGHWGQTAEGRVYGVGVSCVLLCRCTQRSASTACDEDSRIRRVYRFHSMLRAALFFVLAWELGDALLVIYHSAPAPLCDSGLSTQVHSTQQPLRSLPRLLAPTSRPARLFPRCFPVRQGTWSTPREQVPQG